MKYHILLFCTLNFLIHAALGMDSQSNPQDSSKISYETINNIKSLRFDVDFTQEEIEWLIKGQEHYANNNIIDDALQGNLTIKF